MTLVSQPLSTPEWCFPTITNNCEARLAGRKRGHDAECEGEQLEHMDLRGPNKKAKVADSPKNLSNVSNAPTKMVLEAMAPHEPLAGADDWRYQPIIHGTAQNEFGLEEEPEPIDVEKVIAILLQALSPPSAKPDPHMRLCRPRPTSPLSNSPDRVPFVRKSVGGPCPSKPDLSLQKWVLSKNHYEDVRTCPLSRRSSEWIEALHEMGWENLHPIYMWQSQETFESFKTFSNSHDGWIEVDVLGEGQISGRSDGLEQQDKNYGMGDISGWDLEVPSQSTASLLGA